MKISKCKINGKDGYLCSYKQDGRYRRKYFHSKKDAESFKSKLENAESPCQKKLLSLSISQIDDIFSAFNILPKGHTLYEAVCKTFSNYTTANLKHLVNDFNKIKEASGVSYRHLNIVKNRTNALLSNFNDLNNITSQNIFDFISTKGSSRKTIVEWFSTLNEFFKFCIRREAIKSNPLDKWIIDDFGRAKTKKQHKFISVETAFALVDFIRQKYPTYLKYFTLAMFSGIRVAEILRIKESYIDYEKKAISLPAEITKKNRAEYLDDFEPNLWAWLDLLKDKAIIAPSSNTRQRIYKKFSLPQNFARHSFATYHYSLYRDPKQTAAITHHSAQQLMDDYMDALVDKKVAKEYFKILPS